MIVGFRADAGSAVDFADAMRSYVGLLHVEPPKEWDDAAERDAKADSVLHEMVSRSVIDEGKRDYLAGMLAPEEASATGYGDHLDQRAAEIIQLFTSEDRPMWDIVDRGIRRLSAKTHIMRGERANVAAELALRAVRNGPLGSRIVTTRAALERALTMGGLWSVQWSVTQRSPEEIRDAALDEIQVGQVGPAVMELSALAVFWLTARNILIRDSSRTLDQRSPQQILGRLSESEHGIRVLYQAIIDGRDGTPIRAVAEDGRVRLNPAGRALEIDDPWLRRTFPAPGGGQGHGKVVK